MYRILLPLIAATLAGCSSEPAGGRGPFDPVNLPPVQNSPSRIIVPPPTSAPPQAVAQAPQSTQQTDPLLRDVEQTLAGTSPETPPGAETPPVASPTGIGIDPNAQEINLALTTQEQQKVEREEAARRREAARQQLVVINPETAPQVNTSANANVVRFARSTTHSVGDRVYSRNVLRSRSQSNSVCRRFSAAEDAQRQFLANGGPQEDRYNLDPDGDGFACDFDPSVYRQLRF